MNPEVIFVIAPIAVPIGIYLAVSVVLWHRRRARWRETAVLLDAEHVSGGFLHPGSVRGRRHGRAFVIDPGRSTHSALDRHWTTQITAPFLNPGEWLELPPAFFERNADPAEARKRVSHREDMRVFFTRVQVSRTQSLPLSPEEQRELASILEGWHPALSPVGNPVRKGSVHVLLQEVRFGQSGIITDPARLCALVDTVVEIADRIERHPLKSAGG